MIGNKLAIQQILEMIPGHIYWKDREGRFLGCNLAQALAVGCQYPNEVVGKTAYDTLPFNEAKIIENTDKQIMSTGQSVNIEEWTTIASGIKCLMYSYKSPLRDENHNIIGIIGVSLDITIKHKLRKSLDINKKLKAALAESEKIRATQRQFLEDQEHDTRTPLNGIVGAADVLASLTNDQQLLTYIDFIKRSGKELNAYNEELLAALYEGEGYYTCSMRRLDLYALISQVYNLNFATAKIKNLEYKLDYNDKCSIPQYIISDKKLISRCLSNLIGNAVKFTNSGFVYFVVSLLQDTTNNIIVEFKVSDSGIGISDDMQDKIFEIFTKVKASNKGDSNPGRGIGLTLARNAVYALDGELHLKSQLGKGSEFRILLPLEKSLDQTTPI